MLCNMNLPPDTNSGSSASIQLRLTVDQFHQLSDERLPFARDMGLVLENISIDGVRMRAIYNERYLRPGGTIAGPILMALADAAMYAVVLSRVGPVELAVTTNLTINFLRKPAPGDVLAEARLLKLGKRLAVGEVLLYSASETRDKLVAHVASTYSIPPTTVQS